MPKENLQAAYELQAHDRTVLQAQQESKLTSVPVGNFVRSEIIIEKERKWASIYHDRAPSHLPRIKLLVRDCNTKLLSELEPGEPLTAVTDYVVRPDVSFGRAECVTGLVQNGKKGILYISPGFDSSPYQ